MIRAIVPGVIRLEPAHLRAARFLLGWTMRDLARASLVGETTIRRFEKYGEPPLRERTQRDLLQALSAAGVDFIPGAPAELSITCRDGMTLKLRGDTQSNEQD